MADTPAVIPPPPPGFTLDSIPPPPAGFVLDGATAPKPQGVPGVRQKPIRQELIEALIPLFRPGEAGKRLQSGIDSAATFAGENVNDLAAKVMPEKYAAGLGLAANVAVQALPMIAGGEAAKTAAPSVRSAAEGLMQSALKPGYSAKTSGKGAKAVATLLDEGINVSKGGLEKASGMVDELNGKIASAIANSGGTVDKQFVANKINDVISRVEKFDSTPQDAIKAVTKVYDEFIANGLIPDKIPVARAQELKRGIYKVIGEKYGSLGSDWVEAQKALGLGYKEGIVAAVPEVAALNASESELLNAIKYLQRRVATEGNKNPIGLGGWINPKTMVPHLWDRSGVGKSLAARALNAGQEQIPATAARAAIGGAEAINESSNRRNDQRAINELLDRIEKVKSTSSANK